MSRPDRAIVPVQVDRKLSGAVAIFQNPGTACVASRMNRRLLKLREIEMRKLAMVIENAALNHGQPHIAALCPRKERFEQWHIGIEQGMARARKRDRHEIGSLSRL